MSSMNNDTSHTSGDFQIDAENSQTEVRPSVRSLRELIELVSGRDTGKISEDDDAGLHEILPFPFLAIVGQLEMKLALLLALINPIIGGVLLIGPRGTGKTTAVRGLVNLLPQVPRSVCHYGCMPEDIEVGGIDAVCPDCAKKYALGEPLAAMDDVRLVELPLNSRLEDVVGGIDERTAVHERLLLKRGILAQADQNLLYVDEVNLLTDDVVDAILDAAAQGAYTVRRGPVSATYRSRFVLVGSMNPEEGRLRPQIMDRFGLRVIIRGLDDPEERLEVYRRVQSYLLNPRQVVNNYSLEMEVAQAEIQIARDMISKVTIPDSVARIGLKAVKQLNIHSLRAEITLFETARAYAALDGRQEVTSDDINIVMPMALRLRRSSFIEEFFKEMHQEDQELKSVLK
jgi:magnesium chelatase subunit I